MSTGEVVVWVMWGVALWGAIVMVAMPPILDIVFKSTEKITLVPNEHVEASLSQENDVMDNS